MFRLIAKLVLVASIASISASGLFAQGGEKKGWGQVYVASGGAFNGDSEAFFHIGGGGTALIAKGFGVQADLGALGAYKDFGSSALGVFSPGVTYVFSRDRRTTPFLAGGYTLFFRDGTANGMFAGGGVNHWLNDSVGLRFEVRDQIVLEGETIHFFEGRFSILFR